MTNGKKELLIGTYDVVDDLFKYLCVCVRPSVRNVMLYTTQKTKAIFTNYLIYCDKLYFYS